MIMVLDKKPIIIEGRKASRLLDSHKTRLRDEGFDVYDFRRLDSTVVLTSPPLKPEVKSVYVFTDTIHSGETMADFLKYFKTQNIDIDRLYWVLGNYEGINYLLSQGLIDDARKVYALYISNNENEYQITSRKLTVVYASNIESLSPLSSYDIYSVNIILSPTKLISIMNEIISVILGRKINFEEKQDKVFPPNIKQIKFELVEYDEIENYLPNVFTKHDDVSFEGFTIMCKIQQMAIDSSFTIHIKSMLNLNDVRYCDIENRLKEPDLCIKNHWNTDTITSIDPSNLICLPCLDHVFSNYILKIIEEKIVDEFQTYGYDCRQENKYRPI